MAPVPLSERKKLQLQCEWGRCSQVLFSIQAFTNHLMVHAEEFIAGSFSIEQCLSEGSPTNTDEYQCQWVDCGYVTTEGSASLLRHLLFHGYHTRIKWLGTVERERCKVETCQLEPHSRNIIPEVPSSFVCSWEDCSFITNNPDYFYCHVEMHSQMSEAKKGILACQWTECQVKTKDKYKLRDHLRCHSQEKKFGCSQCGGLFSNRTKFFDHIHRQGILDEPNYQCSHCSKVFASERLLRDHMRHHVNHYKCPCCDMTCPAPSVLKKHIQWRHSSERPFACELCEHRAKTRTDMRRHMESHNADDAYQCDVEKCDFTSKSLSALRTHFRKLHSDIEDKRYLCHVCQSKFTRGYRLTNHLKKKHRFKWPSGHVRFRYKEHVDGYLRLQTVRYESIELTQQILQMDPSSQSIPSEGEDSGVGVMGGQTEALQEKSLTKRSSPELDSDSRADLISRELEMSGIQYIQNDTGNVIIIDCSSTVQPTTSPEKPGKKVYNVLDLNESPSPRKGKNKSVASQDSPPDGHSTAPHGREDPVVRDTVPNPESRKRNRSECENLTAPEGHRSVGGETSDSMSSNDSPSMNMFPIEQLQGLDESSDRDSVGERTPKKGRYQYLQVVPEPSVVVSGITDDERMRNLFPRLEDDRMAMAVEAMTNLSRGLGNL